MSKKKALKVIGFILLIVFIMFLVHTIRNYIIITNLQDKISKYSSSTNYYIKSVATEDNGMSVTMRYYRKDNKQVVFMERNLNGEISKISMYDNGERTDIFTETKDSRIVQLNSGTIISVNIYNFLETENNWQTFLGSISSRIKSTNYNEKDCYVISGFLSLTSLTFEGQETYIEKDTGLFVKTSGDGVIMERNYEFDNVEDSIFVEPDISQYTLKENK